MKSHVYVRKEFIVKVGVAEKDLKKWEDLKLIKPVGFTDEDVPFYAEHSIQEVNHIRKLVDLGYDLEEIQKIIKRVGLPKTETEKIVHKQSDQYLTVGGLAEKVGVSARTLKHWEDVGIIVPDMRTEGGFRLYSEAYVYLCKLIRDLQLFGYSLDEIKMVSAYFRDFLNMQDNFDDYKQKEMAMKLDEMLVAIAKLFEKTNQLKEGIARWEDLLKKKKKEIQNLKNRNAKRNETQNRSKS